ncbi:SDR family NAD(P)-dependent oxidoreductase [Neopusillimonas aromaticivorans]|uniref:SDR family NAD(P)-dependent oxidoreductase n=1 Tax=Neopusillimonas aromaticivorans TaxID=2979868 RepID=UPI00259733F6|nr:SDR family NAD(P)-dependent oxidoreductase [Neopusillimonas aromaticivorans]WJJ92595.1 SDR family NAD(P)-dependent oxidoreductase [Neopusillimonas aromaticivorans]
MSRLQDYVAIVTGAAGGIGRGIVQRYIDEGARVVAADLNTDALASLVRAHPDAIKVVKAEPVVAKLAEAGATVLSGKRHVPWGQEVGQISARSSASSNPAVKRS